MLTDKIPLALVLQACITGKEKSGQKMKQNAKNSLSENYIPPHLAFR